MAETSWTPEQLDIMEREGGVIVIRAELWPYGKEHLKIELSQMHITNDQTGNPIYGNYRVEANYSLKQRLTHWTANPWKRGRVEHFPRLKNVWYLLQAALNSLRIEGG